MAYYVKIEKPREFRRDMLESSKQVIGCLQDYRNVSYIRDRKRQLLKQLEGEIKEIMMLVARLDKVLPEKHLREEAMRQAKEADRKAKAAAKKAKADAKKVVEKEKSSKKPAKKKALKKSSSSKKKVEKAPAPAPKKELTEMDKLNDALSSIESKLSEL